MASDDSTFSSDSAKPTAYEASASCGDAPEAAGSGAVAQPSLSRAVAGAPRDDSDRTERRKRFFYSVWAVVGVAAIVAIVVYLLNLLSIPVAIVIWTAVIVFCLRGPVNFLESKGINRTLGTAIAYVLLIVVLGVIGLVMFSPIFGVSSQFHNLVSSLPDYVSGFITWAEGLYAEYAHLFDNESVRQWLDALFTALSEGATAIASSSAAGVVAFGTSMVNTFIAIGFALVVAFWVLMELPAIGREFMRLVGEAHREEAEMLHLTFTRVMGGYIKATVLQCVIIGAGCCVLFTVCGIPNALALGAIAGIMNIIPIVGPWLGGILAGVVGIFVSPLIAFVAVVGTVIIQQFVYTFVSPRIMQNSVDVHPAITFIALMAGSAIGGAMSGLTGSLVGMLLSIPAVAVMKSVFVYYFEKRTGRRLVASDGVFFKGTPAEGDTVDPIADATSPHPHVAPQTKRKTGNTHDEVHDHR